MEHIIPLPRNFTDEGPFEAAASRDDLQRIIVAIAEASVEISRLVALGEFAPASRRPGRDCGGCEQIEVDHSDNSGPRAETIFVEALGDLGVKEVLSAGRDAALPLDSDGTYAVAIDALDGASNIDTNMPLGTIFSVSYAGDATMDRSGQMQLAAGFVVYGPQTNLVLTLGAGVDIFRLDREAGTYRLAESQVTVPETTSDYAIDASNYRNWPSAVRGLIDDHLDEADEPGARTFNMRWIGSLVAEAYRILVRGGVFMCPPDRRNNPEKGCQRLLTAAHPIAFVMEQAGARATTGYAAILDRPAKRLGERTPFIFGSRETVERIERLHALPETFSETAPLFAKRGLFRD